MTELEIPLKVQVHGEAVIRDKDGNIKGTFSFGDLITAEQAEQLKQMVKPQTKEGD